MLHAIMYRCFTVALKGPPENVILNPSTKVNRQESRLPADALRPPVGTLLRGGVVGHSGLARAIGVHDVDFQVATIAGRIES